MTKCLVRQPATPVHRFCGVFCRVIAVRGSNRPEPPWVSDSRESPKSRVSNRAALFLISHKFICLHTSEGVEGLVQVERNVMAGLLGFIAICLMAANLVE